MFDNPFDSGSILDDFNDFDELPNKRVRVQPSGASVRRKLRHKALDTLGGKCSQCGFDDYRALDIDHVNNDGGEERRTLTQAQIYRKVIKDDSGYQCLCANCHRIKTYEHLYSSG